MIVRPTPKWLRKGIEFALAPIAVVLLAPLFASLWIDDFWRRKTGPSKSRWQPWFAWMPTRLGWDPYGEVVWLERIERINADFDWIICRRPGDTSVKAPYEIDYSEIG